jgi:hypothetical protein
VTAWMIAETGVIPWWDAMSWCSAPTAFAMWWQVVAHTELKRKSAGAGQARHDIVRVGEGMSLPAGVTA